MIPFFFFFFRPMKRFGRNKRVLQNAMYCCTLIYFVEKYFFIGYIISGKIYSTLVMVLLTVSVLGLRK